MISALCQYWTGLFQAREYLLLLLLSTQLNSRINNNNKRPLRPTKKKKKHHTPFNSGLIALYTKRRLFFSLRFSSLCFDQQLFDDYSKSAQLWISYNMRFSTQSITIAVRSLILPPLPSSLSLSFVLLFVLYNVVYLLLSFSDLCVTGLSPIAFITRRQKLHAKIYRF